MKNQRFLLLQLQKGWFLADNNQQKAQIKKNGEKFT